jgi:hypothetical protein
VADLEPSRSRSPRSTREQRAYRLAVAGGVSAAATVVGFILTVAGVIGIGIPLILAGVTAVCVLLFRAAVRG